MDTTTPVPAPDPSAPLQTVESRYSHLLSLLGVQGHQGAVAEIAALRQHAGLRDASDPDASADDALGGLIQRGRLYAEALAAHLANMGAARLNIPVKLEEGNVMVTAGYSTVPEEVSGAVERAAQALYEAYCDSVEWKAFNGATLPTWAQFSTDPTKEKQAQAWRAVGTVAVTSGMGTIMAPAAKA